LAAAPISFTIVPSRDSSLVVSRLVFIVMILAIFVSQRRVGC
jgi:hypothetical protein